MKKSLILGLFLVLLLSGCQQSNSGGSKAGAPAKISVSNARGVYLESSSAAAFSRSRSIMGRDVVSSGSAELGAITSDGTAETVTFTDTEGVSVTVAINQAMQLTDKYVLLAYQYNDTEATAILDLEAGTLTSVTVIPSNWSNIFARGTNAWYVSSGTFYRLSLETGTATVLSTEGEVFSWSGNGVTDAIDQNGTLIWGSDTWCYSDAAGNAYAICMPNTGSIRAQVITSAGVKKDFGQNALVENFANQFCAGSMLIDQNDYYVYVIQSKMIVDNKPSWGGPGLTEIGGVALQSFLVSFDPASDKVISYNTFGEATAYCIIPGATVNGFGRFIGFGHWMQSGVMSIGTYSFTYTPTSITCYDTSSIPVSHVNPNGYSNLSVWNWKYSGGTIYAGPTTSSPTIQMVKFNGSASAYTLLTDSTITSWSVVGGVLFYTNATGTYKATVNKTAGTIGTVEAYAGHVEAVTQ